MNYTWLLRMARWARRPPSMTQVKIVAVVTLAVIAIVVIEKLGYWPDWATVNPRALRAPRP
ncbi:hypothetical protein B6V72_01410 [Thioclava sp. F34-6]|uniref:hypothetical protein n=1 Tax=Thioclava sp. F34-6 TaxID=1973003 RepID=UPI000B53A362|nr:hypothetical protein [Thioclava sp. F34-6]OWY15281.1 hypothetical protein B6V72_01410 [Thioclava sp. F34-6]